MKSLEREDRPLNTSDGREVIKFLSRSKDEGELKGDIADAAIEEEREVRENKGC